MAAPELKTTIPTQVTNERAAYGPFNLKEFIVTSDNSAIRFSAGLTSGAALPQGMICTEDGILTGIPAKGTEGNYEVNVTAQNDAGTITATFALIIKPVYAGDTQNYFDKIKAQVWEALENKMPIPELDELYSREVTPLEIYYLLERWGILIVWDAFNLDAPGEKKLLNLKGTSPHYNVYDRGSCIVAAPKDLYSYERTIEDGLQTARVVAREVYQRKWTIEMAGFEKLVRSAWIELQHLGDEFGQRLEIINYNPSENDIKVYTTQAVYANLRQKPE